MDFLTGITILVLYQLIGEAIALVLKLPIPGPVIGMALLFLTLMIRGGAPAPLEGTAGALLGHLSLLFVPAGVGVLVHFRRIGAEWMSIGVALVLSTLITLAVTALVMRLMMRKSVRGGTP
ncbi:MAG: CidA/LrgA family protein [Gammaproteobacteria bacterium]|nr:CidA/LrgA family protein [Gammaproteobacteria bacterium]